MHRDPARTQKPVPFRIMAISISMAIHLGLARNVLNSPNEVRHDARPEGDSITHQMADYGVIFSDGVEGDYLQFNSGMTATIEVADRSGSLVV